MLIESYYQSVDELNLEFAQRIALLLEQGIAEKGRASLLVSGGNTPKALFERLSQQVLDWAKVDISLVDERWVESDDSASNEKMVREHLLVNQAAQANFFGLKQSVNDAKDAVNLCRQYFSALSQPVDALILGMGEDGHTASLFPCSEQLVEGLDPHNQDAFIAVTPTTAPHQRMSMVLAEIVQAKRIFLHLTGDKKKDILHQAMANNQPMETPICAVLNATNVELVWAPQE